MLLVKFPGQLAWWLRGAVPLPYRPRLRSLLAIPKQRQRWWRLILPPVRFRYRWHSRIYLHLSRQFWLAMGQAKVKVALTQTTQTFSTLILPEPNALIPTTSYFNLPKKLLASLDSYHDFPSDSTSAILSQQQQSAINPNTNQKVLATISTDFTRKPTYPNNSLNFSSSSTTVTAAVITDSPLSQLKSAHRLKQLINLTPTTDTSLTGLTNPYLDQQFTNELATTNSFIQVPLISESLSSSVNNIDYTEAKSAITTSLEYTIPGHHSKSIDPNSSGNSIKSLLVNSAVPTNSIEESVPPNNSLSQSQLVSEAKPPITSTSMIGISPTKLINPYLNQQTAAIATDSPLSQLKSAHRLKQLINLTPTTDTSLTGLTNLYLDQQLTSELATTDSFTQVPLTSESLSSSVNNINYTEAKSAITTPLEYTIPGHHSKPIDPNSSSNSIKSLLVNSAVPTNSIKESIPPNNSLSQSQLVGEAKPLNTSTSMIDISPTKLIDPYLNQQVVNGLTTKDSATTQVPLALKNLSLAVSNISHIEAKPVVKISATNFTADQETVTSILTDHTGKPIYPDNPLNSFSPPANIFAAFVSPNSSLISSKLVGGLKQLLGLTALVNPRLISQSTQELAIGNTFTTQPSLASGLTWLKVIQLPMSKMSYSPSQHQELITSLTTYADDQLPLVAGQLQLQLRGLTTRSNTVPTEFSLNFPSNYFPYSRLERRQSTTLTGLTKQSSLPTKPRSNPEEFFVPPPKLPQIHLNSYHRQAQIRLAENFWERHYLHRIHWHLFIR